MQPYLQFSVLCDDVGRTGDGKLIIHGVFEGVVSSSFPASHRACYVCNRWAGGTGAHRERVRVLSPDARHTVLEGPETEFTLADRSACHTLICRFEGLTFPGPGVHWVQVLLDDRVVSEYGLSVKAKDSGQPAGAARPGAPRPPVQD